MPLKSETVTLPAFLASALINGDVSDIEEHDLHLVEACHAYVAPGRIVSAEGESFFAHSCDLPGFHLGADMLEFTVLYDDAPTAPAVEDTRHDPEI